ncbi:hypothetical protein JOE11_005561 [Robbsia andropogonis]|uniref:hypothetical protein n=1 Tax=Robbsia andropogonis TaxID=28092 RepID=UPI003D2453CF
MNSQALASSILSGGRGVPDRLETADKRLCWVEALQQVAYECIDNEQHREQCLTTWVTYGGRIREEVGDDVLLVRLLRKILPSYKGPSLMLFRGESAGRFEAGTIGLCWSSQRHTAEMFGGGLNAYYEGGGVLLSAMVDASGIISGPGRHNKWIGEEEYTIDPSAVTRWEMLERYPQPTGRD